MNLYTNVIYSDKEVNEYLFSAGKKSLFFQQLLIILFIVMFKNKESKNQESLSLIYIFGSEIKSFSHGSKKYK
jgi:hypothetical protein